MRAVEFGSGPERLRGYYHPPSHGHAAGGVLIIPGFADTAAGMHSMHIQTARSLADQGCAVLRFDYRGLGESDGDFRRFTVRTGLEDVDAAMDALSRQPEVDPTRMAVVGYSLGGSFAVCLAARNSAIRAAVLWAPVAYMSKVFGAFFQAHHLEQAEADGWMDWLGWPIGKAYMSTIDAIDPVSAMSGIKGAVLVIQGTADQEVPPENGRAYHEQGAALHWIDQADHLFSSVRWQQEAIAQTSRWIQPRLEEKRS